MREKRFGVTLSYRRTGGIDRALDSRVHARVRVAVPRIDHGPGTSIGFEADRTPTVRILDYDDIEFPGGFTRVEAEAIAEAARAEGVAAVIKRVRRA